MGNEFSREDSKKVDRQRGAASIFIVIFFALLTGVITVSFVRITNQDQQQALNNDLSQSAYDAAKAGTTDANRVIDYCENDAPDKTACLAKLNNECQDVAEFASKIGLEMDGYAVRVGTGSNDAKLNQSYTCAKINLEPDAIAVTLEDRQMRIIELKSASQINAIRVKWFDNKDHTDQPMTLPKAPVPDKKFPKSATDEGWGGASTPPVMRVQLVNLGPNPTVDKFSSTVSAAFLYPATSGNTGTALGPGQPVKTPCKEVSYENGELACSADMTAVIPAGTSAYLVVMPIYNKTNIEIQGLTGIDGEPVGLQGYPSIDVTGKADDVFRRVRSTIDLHGTRGGHDLPAFDTVKTLCKNFGVSNTDYYPDGASEVACGDPE